MSILKSILCALGILIGMGIILVLCCLFVLLTPELVQLGILIACVVFVFVMLVLFFMGKI